MSKSKKTFESAFERIEEISAELEANTVGLDDSIKLYEEGMKLIDFLRKKFRSSRTKSSTASKKCR